ncbi:DEAD/DEAH box helicase [Oleidesulfovibrio sp.]|uniref:DEAD/DEAH box helicase n=1 Tax=Oleidesulfovibrio sp. TaxID=2909707 RepID=UPI003A85814D
MTYKFTKDTVAEYIDALKASDRLGSFVTCHKVLQSKQARTAPVTRPWPRAVQGILEHAGITALYAHQALATDHIRAGRHVVVATPTASGKTFIYNLPVIEQILHDPETRALYLFPLKALAQDQLATLNSLTEHWSTDARPTAAIYDGDTTAWFRKKIRNNPPNILLTNPEMLHLSILPHHEQWTRFLAGLSYIIVDEAHTYRGVLGSHMAQLFRRLGRVCSRYGTAPSFVFCSATVGNPEELATSLTGIRPQPVLESGAPQGRRHFVFIDPPESPSTTAIQLLKAALARGMRTIVYCQSRRMTELISLWAGNNAGAYANRISAYRAGFLPEERREIESRMNSGDLLAVITTSALELGIDIGSLDLCILVGYPGTVMSTLQRGGRVGRAQQESAVVLVAGEDALDQYFMRHPEDFFERPAEKAVLNPHNPVILERHLECAAAEFPLTITEPWFEAEAVRRAAAALEEQSMLLRTEDGTRLLAARKRPQRHVDLRGAGPTFHIEDLATGNVIGSVDGHRAFRETHPGAVYLHRGRSFVVTDLDVGARTVKAVAAKVDYFTRVRGNKSTEILQVIDQKVAWNTRVCFGRLRVTEQITGYEKRNTRSGQMLGITPLDLPPHVFETEGIWFEVQDAAQREVENAYLHFMGSIHALEHAAIGILPLIVMTDRNDLGGISTPMHLQVGKPCVFVYDGMPGGAGLSRMAFDKAEELFASTRKVIAECRCETGCPSCVQSPKCGSGNRPIDKDGALFLLDAMKCAAPPADGSFVLEPLAPSAAWPAPDIREQTGTQNTVSGALPRPEHYASNTHPPVTGGVQGTRHAHADGGNAAMPAQTAPVDAPDKVNGVDNQPYFSPMSGDIAANNSGRVQNISILTSPQEPRMSNRFPITQPASLAVLDVETRRSAQEVGGWHKADKMGVSIAVLYDSRDDSFYAYTEEQVPQMLLRLAEFDLVIGFNIIRFDYKVLTPLLPAGTPWQLTDLPTLDMLDEVKKRLSYRLSLDNLASATLDAPKSADGLQALKWWKEGKIDEITRYCEQDVRITRDLYLFGRENGYLLFTNKAKQKVRVPASWQK